VAVALLGLAEGPGLANGPNVGRDAGMVFPVHNPVVQLVSERVVIQLPWNDGSDGSASCRYVLRNLSDAPQTFEMAFVTNPPFAADNPTAYRSHYSDAEFTVRQNGRDLMASYEPVDISAWATLVRGLPDSLPVWRVSIPPDTSTTLEMDYRIEWSGGADGSSISQYFRYQARPAALWAGTIDNAEVVFEVDVATMRLIDKHRDVDGCFELEVSPTGAIWEGNRLSWRFRDWEPSEDPEFYLKYCDPMRVR
jgi:hypothetical protein